MTDCNRLDTLRDEIKNSTLEIIRLIGKRAALSEEVGIEKRNAGIPIVNQEVEKHLRAEVVNHCRNNGLDESFGLNLLNQLVNESIRIQETLIKTPPPPTAYDIFVKGRELERAGKELIHLEVGEPDFGPPLKVKKAVAISVDVGQSHYTESAGILSFREKIAHVLGHRYKREISPEEVFISVSGRFALFTSIAANVRRGDEVIIVDPSYPAYSECVKDVGARPVRFPTDLNSDWNIDVNRLENYINPTTKAIVLNSPGSPTGKVLDASTLEEIADLASANDIFLLSDEVYSNFTSTQHTSVLELPHDNHVLVDSFSKRFGMSGFRLGYAISDAETIRRMTKIQNLYLTCVPEFIQYAGMQALDCDDDAKQYASLIEKRLEVACKELDQLPLSYHPPDGAFYIFPKLTDGITNGQEFADRLLSEVGVCIVPGLAYGTSYSDFFRLSVCQPEEKLVEAIERMGAVLG